MWWSRKKPEPPLREQLVEARAILSRQIEIIRAPAGVNTGLELGPQIARLEALLADLDRALAELDRR
jgi:hypothetical protein